MILLRAQSLELRQCEPANLTDLFAGARIELASLRDIRNHKHADLLAIHIGLQRILGMDLAGDVIPDFLQHFSCSAGCGGLSFVDLPLGEAPRLLLPRTNEQAFLVIGSQQNAATGGDLHHVASKILEELVKVGLEWP